MINSINNLRIFLTALLCSFSLTASANYLHEGPILLRNINLIDGLGHDVKPMRDVLIRDGKIARVAVTTMIGTLPDNTKIIDGKGLTVMPGLMDVHTHISSIDYSNSNIDADTWQHSHGMKRYALGFGYTDSELEGMQRYLNANLNAGVTSILEVGGDQKKVPMLRDEIRDEKRLGPSIYSSGDFISALTTTQQGVVQLTSKETVAEINKLLDDKQALGIKHIKLYAGITIWEARHITREAHKRGMRVIADMWCSNQSQDFMQISGIDSFAHGGCLEVTAEDAQWMASNGKYSMFTLVIFDNQRGARGYVDYKAKSFLKDPLVVDVFGKKTVQEYYDAYLSQMEIWNHGEEAMYTVQHWGDKSNNLKLNMKNMITQYQAGVTIGIGTDAGFPPGSWPGEALHHEMALHVKAGLEPLQVIKMATFNNARLIGVEDKVGSIEKGKVADLLVVKGSPAENIADTKKIAYVIKSGKLIDRRVLHYKP